MFCEKDEMGVLYMKKISAITLIGLVLLFPTARNWYDTVTAPDKVLMVGEKVGVYATKFEIEVRDQEKIAQYENILEELVFEESEWEPETYPDFVLKIVYKEGYFIGFHHIWIEEQGGSLLIPNGSDKNFAKLTVQQVEKLKEIVH